MEDHSYSLIIATNADPLIRSVSAGQMSDSKLTILVISYIVLAPVLIGS